MKKKALSVAIIIVALIALVPAGLVATGLLPYRLYVVQTGSMSPTIPPESVILTRQHAPKLGQAITFYQHDGVITHRWIGTNPDGTLITKGDGNETADPWATNKSDVIGGVTWSAPKIGYWIMYLKNPFGIGTLLLGALSIWLLVPFLRVEPDEVAPVQAA